LLLFAANINFLAFICKLAWNCGENIGCAIWVSRLYYKLLDFGRESNH
jgi:hypothetical protein